MKFFSQFQKLLNEALTNKYNLFSEFNIMSPEEFIEKESTNNDVDKVEEGVNDLEASIKPLSDKEAEEYFDKTMAGEKTKKDRLTMPYVHKSNIPISDESGKQYDLKKLKKQISTRPKKLLKQNSKITHSGGDSSMYYNLSLPALTGLAVNEETDEFIIVNTCPGAGECKLYCYAMQGGYVMFPAPSMQVSQSLTFLLNDPNGFVDQLSQEISVEEKKNNKKKIKTVIRWHDAGDFFSPKYMNLAFDIAKKFPNIEFYAYTKMANVVNADNKPNNFIISFSEGAKPSETKLVNLPDTKKSIVIPSELFWNRIQREGKKLHKDAKGRIQFKTEQDFNDFKQDVSSKYKIPLENLITYDELLEKPQGTKQKWSVLVFPGDGDESANRKDVLNTLLLIH